MNLQEKVLDTITKNNLIQKKDSIVIGVSGGPDSMTLLNVLFELKKQLQIDICVAHVNHMIRKEAKQEEEYVQNFCKKIGVKCYTKNVDVKSKAQEFKMSTETIGRNARYEFFEEIAKKVNANKVATAHTANDNAETVLMNLMRGSGISGLKGIEIKRNEKFIRPLLECTRKEIEDYCKEKNLQPKYDKTNMENIYTRNKIRNKLIPYIEKEFNPNIIETLNRMSSIVQKEEQYFIELIENVFKETKIDQKDEKRKSITLNLKKFNNLDNVIKSRLILYTINKLFDTTQGIEKIHIEDIIKLCQNNVGNKYLTPNKNLKVFVKKGEIIFSVLN